MPTTPSAKTKSPRGSSGPGVPPEAVVDSEAYQETLATAPVSGNLDTLPTPPDSVSEPEDVAPADESGDEHVPFIHPSPVMSSTDLKLATRMTKAIANHLGLSGRTRSVRV